MSAGHSLRTTFPALVASALMLSSALAERAWLSPDRNDAQIEAAVAQLNELPRTLGPWSGVDIPLDPLQLRAAGVAGGLAREYTHDETGAAFTLTILVGPPGALAVHPPTACFRGRGDNLLSGPTGWTFPVGGRTHEFRSAIFEAPAPRSQITAVAWSWQDGDGDTPWTTPTFPRWTFATSPVLKKLYLTRESTALDTSELEESLSFDESSAKDFLSRVLSEIGHH